MQRVLPALVVSLSLIGLQPSAMSAPKVVSQPSKPGRSARWLEAAKTKRQAKKRFHELLRSGDQHQVLRASYEDSLAREESEGKKKHDGSAARRRHMRLLFLTAGIDIGKMYAEQGMTTEFYLAAVGLGLVTAAIDSGLAWLFGTAGAANRARRETLANPLIQVDISKDDLDLFERAGMLDPEQRVDLQPE